MDGRATPYDEDVYQWSLEQAAALRRAASSGTNLPVDWENVAEEIESVGRSELRSLESALMRVIEHLLKLEYSPAADPRAGWRTSVLNHRIMARREIKDSPSLRGKLDLDDVYADALRLAALGLREDSLDGSVLPTECPYDLTRLLDEEWWPTNRHGLVD